MIAFLRDAPAGEVTVPGTITALLSARLDQLEPSERAVLQRGAVEGRVFHRGAVQALGPEEAQVGAYLTALVRKELIRPDRPQFAGEDAFRFRHLLIRDAAYDSLPKEARAESHERLADWLGERRSELSEIDELVGHHLEQAHAYRVELRPVDDAWTPSCASRQRASLRRRLTSSRPERRRCGGQAPQARTHPAP